jgi:F-type H+-transporting ATPase subunit epsilon
MKFLFELITPEKTVYKEEIEQLTIPTSTGEITVLPNHSSLFTKVEQGEMIIKKNSKEQFLAVTEGFLEVNKNIATLLADYAVRSEEIEVSKAIDAQKRAEKVIKESKEKISREDFALAESQFRRSILELKVAGKRRKFNLPPGTKA